MKFFLDWYRKPYGWCLISVMEMMLAVVGLAYAARLLRGKKKGKERNN